MIQEHEFTKLIRQTLKIKFGDISDEIFDKSLLLKYINEKTKSANKGSKSRGSFGNLYSIYVLVEDYVNKEYHGKNKGKYEDYEGANFKVLFKRQRELPFGSKLQNHSLNNRTNSEFKKFFPTENLEPIIRDQDINKYWINENLLIVNVKGVQYNLAETILEIIDLYVSTKQDSFQQFITNCEELKELDKNDKTIIIKFIKSLLAPNVDARLFEIVSYSILKYYYNDQKIYWGYDIENINEDNLKLYKTGRTNANDGGIDFVMKPLGRFFQVTETLDFKKYFLDIEKLERYPVTFVIKSNDDIESIKKKIKDDANKTYPIKSIVDKYMNCIEEIINVQFLENCLDEIDTKGMLDKVLDEIILQSKVEFNLDEDNDIEDSDNISND